jgi:BNR repeat-like domain
MRVNYFPSALIAAAILVALSGCKTGSRQVPGASAPVRLSSGNVDGAEPAIAGDADGSVYVAWVNHGETRAADVMVARFTSDGTMQGAAVRVNPGPGIATAWRGDPPTIAVASDRTVFVGWTARVETEVGHATEIYVSASRDQARTFSQPVKVNDDKGPADHGMHSLAIGTDGRVYVAWLDERNIAPMPATDKKMKEGTSGHHMESNREVFIASSGDGGRTFSANKLVATDACPCCKTALAVGGDGRVYVSWRQVLPGDFRHIAVASSNDQGLSFSEPKIVSDDQWMIAGCPVSGPAMLAGADGRLRVLWYSAGKNGETGLYVSESTDAGKTFGPRLLISKGETRGTPVLVKAGIGVAAVWQGNGTQIMAALFYQNSTAAPQTISSGGLPAAVETPTHLFTAYIAKAERPAVWVVSTRRLR